jgi:hypothetical protein
VRSQVAALVYIYSPKTFLRVFGSNRSHATGRSALTPRLPASLFLSLFLCHDRLTPQYIPDNFSFFCFTTFSSSSLSLSLSLSLAAIQSPPIRTMRRASVAATRSVPTQRVERGTTLDNSQSSSADRTTRARKL